MSDPEVFYQYEATPYWNDPDSPMTSNGIGWHHRDGGGPYDTAAEALAAHDAANREDDREGEIQDEFEEAQADAQAAPAWCRWCNRAPCRCEGEDAKADREGFDE